MRRTLTALVSVAATVAGFLVFAPVADAAGPISAGAFTQCLNGGPPSTATNCTNWSNGAINAVNSHYGEDNVVPQRLVLSVADTNQHSITFDYDTMKGSVHAYDSLATWNITQFTADPCQGIAPALCTVSTTAPVSPSTFPMASDPLAAGHELPAASRQWTLYGGTITGTTPIVDTGSGTANAGITFKATTAGAQMVLLFGGHLAVSGTVARGWGAGLGASNVSGGPYHISLGQGDGSSIGSQSNGIQAGALVAGVPNFTITKSANPTTATAGVTTVTYTITVTNTGTGPGSATFTDNFDDRLTPTTPTSSPTGGTCNREPSGTDRYFTCGTIDLAAGASQTFTYTAVMPTGFSTGINTGGCTNDTYPVTNTATLATGGTPGTATVCVSAAPSFTIAKSADESTVNPGGTIHYHVLVTNTGSSAGSTTFTDDYDDRLTITAPAGCTLTTTGTPANKIMTCTTNTINALVPPATTGNTQQFDYTATVPTTFSGSAGTGCGTGQFAIANSAALTSVSTGSSGVTVCVNATPSFSISKSASPNPTTPGATVTYTVTVTNGGAAAGSTSFTDVYDSRISPSAVTSSNTANTTPCTNNTTTHTLSCSTLSIPGDDGSGSGANTEIFTYTATMPATFDGAGTGCNPGQYAVANTAKLTGQTTGALNTVCVAAAPVLVVHKSASPTTGVKAGDTVTYTVTVDNTAGTASGSTTFTDDYDDRLTPSPVTFSPADPGGTAGCTAVSVSGNSELSCNSGKVLAGTSRTFTYTAVMPATFSGSDGQGGCGANQFPVTNMVVLANGSHDSTLTCVNASPSLAISKTASPANPVTPGTVITYTVTVTNNGTAQGSKSFVDNYDDRLSPSSVTVDPAANDAGCTQGTIPTNDAVLSCTSGIIAAKSSRTFTYTATMPGTFTDPGTGCPSGQYAVTNSANFSGATTNPASATVCVSANPQFVITKTADPVDANPGQQVTYTITVTNTGKASGSTTFTDDYDNRLDASITAPAGCTKVSGTLQCSTGTISADPGTSGTGNTKVFTYTANMPSTFNLLSPTTGCTAPRGKYSVTNTATLTGSNSGTPSSATAVVCVNASPTFTITKSATPNPVAAGGAVTYTVTVTNGGSAAGSTTFVDDYDDRLSVTPPAGCTLGTTGTAPNLNKVMNCSTGTISADPGSNTQTFTYTVNMPGTFNGGAGTGGCAAGQYPVSNKATLANGMFDPVTVCVTAAPNFTVTKTVSPTTASAGDTVTYTITVTNSGTAAGSTTFQDNYDDRLTPTGFPATCSLGTINNGTDKVLNCTTGTIAADAGSNTQVFQYTVTLPATFTGSPGNSDSTCPGKYEIDNLVTLDNGNTAPRSICVSATPTFTIDKAVSPTSGVQPGGMITYTVTITNTGTAPGSTTFIDDYDDSVTLSPVTTNPAGGSCTPGIDPNNSSNHILVCQTSSIEAKATQVFTYTATVPTNFTGSSGGGGCATGSYPIKNKATLTSVSTGNGTATTCVTASPDFSVQKSADATTVIPGQTVTYHLLVTNTGHATGTATIQDKYDPRLTPTNFSTSNCSLGTLTDGTKVINCTTDSLDPGKSQDITYQVTVPSFFSGDPGAGCGTGQYALHNSVSFVSPTDTGDSLTVCVNAAPSFTVTKTVVQQGPYTPGEQITYRITVTNGGTAAGSTTFTDNYDDRLTPTGFPSSCSLTTLPNSTDKVLNCTTGTISADPGVNGNGNVQVFTYNVTLPATFDGGNGTANCGSGQYPVTNSVKLANGSGDGVTVCVNASPSFTINKVANPTTTTAGQAVTYTITVTNTGTASGSTTFVDNYDDRLTISSVTSNPAGAQCTNTTTGDKTLSCTTGNILGGNGQQTFTYSANMPPSFAGISGGAGCSYLNPQQYPVTNSVQLANGLNKAATVCVNAAPVANLTKSVVKTVNTDGTENLVYTITYTNTGTAAASSGVIADTIPSGTTYVSCGNGCQAITDPVSGAVTGVTWNTGSVAALGGTGTVTLTVHVIATAVCQINNTAYLTLDTNPAVASNVATITIDPLPNPAGAHASGSAIGAQVKTSGIVGINLGPVGQVSTVRNGLGPTQTANKSVLGVSLPANGSLVRIPVVNETSASGVSANPAFAQDVTSAAVDHVCLLPIGNICTVQADTVQAVASTLATGAWATYSSGGSTIQNLKIVGVPTVVDLNTTVKINLNPLIFGAGSYVAINERTGSAGLVGSTYVADAQVTLIHLVVTGLLGLQAANVIVSQATSHADFPQTLLCGNTPHQSVSGHAFVAQLRNAPTLADTTVGYVAIPPTGANETQQIAGVQIPLGILGAAAGASRSFSNMNASTSYAESSAEIAGNNGTQVCVVKLSATSCLITANLIHSQSQTTATAAGATATDAGTSLANVSVAGIPVGVTIPPNLAIIIPGMGYVVLNEQMCDNGGLTYTHKCTGAHHAGLTVRAVDLVFTFLGSGLGVVPATQLIIGEAHSDATFGA